MNCACPDLCGGCPAMGIPTAIPNPPSPRTNQTRSAGLDHQCAWSPGKCSHLVSTSQTWRKTLRLSGRRLVSPSGLRQPGIAFRRCSDGFSPSGTDPVWQSADRVRSARGRSRARRAAAEFVDLQGVGGGVFASAWGRSEHVDVQRVQYRGDAVGEGRPATACKQQGHWCTARVPGPDQ